VIVVSLLNFQKPSPSPSSPFFGHLSSEEMTKEELLEAKKASIKQELAIKRRLKVINTLLKEMKSEKKKKKEKKKEKEVKKEEEEEALCPPPKKRMRGRKY
jgi:hypothetical protein